MPLTLIASASALSFFRYNTDLQMSQISLQVNDGTANGVLVNARAFARGYSGGLHYDGDHRSALVHDA
jgi:hypothetical protein